MVRNQVYYIFTNLLIPEFHQHFSVCYLISKNLPRFALFSNYTAALSMLLYLSVMAFTKLEAICKTSPISTFYRRESQGV